MGCALAGGLYASEWQGVLCTLGKDFDTRAEVLSLR
jgi:hypothetical protein